MLKNIFISIFIIVTLGLVAYSIHLFILIVLYLTHKTDEHVKPALNPHSELPPVLIQIPMRNEPYVAVGILQAVVNIDWPKDKLYIQVLDDSDDETLSIAVHQVLQYQEENYNITLIHRKNRDGYKAGALKTGLAYSHCEYIAVFDADFIPRSSFLKQTIPYLHDNPQIAWVQTRWVFMNADESFVTHCQAIALDGHFVIDHIARNRSDLMMNFNGTAGIWRRTAIEQSGGWQSDTLAEDLDLSYRAQLNGYKSFYLPSVTSPSQLPNNITDYIQQQRRWAKGAAQTFRKLTRLILKSQHQQLGAKVMALFHLSGYFTQLLLVLLILLSLPMTLLVPTPPAFIQILGPMSLVPLAYYALSQHAIYEDGLKRMAYYPLLVLLAMSFSVDISISIIDGFWHSGGVFVRTPKYYRDRNGPYIPEAQQKYSTFDTLRILLALYSIATVYLAYSTKVVHYIIPNILFILAITLLESATRFGEMKRREK